MTIFSFEVKINNFVIILFGHLSVLTHEIGRPLYSSTHTQWREDWSQNENNHTKFVIPHERANKRNGLITNKRQEWEKKWTEKWIDMKGIKRGKAPWWYANGIQAVLETILMFAVLWWTTPNMFWTNLEACIMRHIKMFEWMETNGMDWTWTHKRTDWNNCNFRLSVHVCSMLNLPTHFRLFIVLWTAVHSWKCYFTHCFL